jgi:hypothetical protein
MKIWKIMLAGVIFFGGVIVFLARLPPETNDDGGHKRQSSAEAPKAIATYEYRKQNGRLRRVEVIAPTVPDLSCLPPIPGDSAYVDKGFEGCKDERDLSRVRMLLHQNDVAAAVTYANTKGCKLFDTGAAGIVEDSILENSCFRPQGNPYCYWIPSQALCHD